MTPVIIESPYAGTSRFALVRWFQRLRNVQYARACVRDSLRRGEAPIASHLLYTQSGILRDDVPEERQWGINAGLAWGPSAKATVLYTDLGISPGMKQGAKAARREGRKIIHRQLFKPVPRPAPAAKVVANAATDIDELL